jgi:cytochrome c oxidase subunit 2
MQHVLQPGGPQAFVTQHLWYVFLITVTLVFIVVMIVLLLAIRRGSQAGRLSLDGPPHPPEPGRERRITTVVGGAVALTALILFGLLVADFLTDRNLTRLRRPNPLEITVTGHQWWWEVRYEDSIPSRTFTTANEIHIPTGRPIRFTLLSTDVIHSFWAPNLSGKKDLIPGLRANLWFQADSAGTYQGQCAEFCGHQHAHMRFLVIAQTPENFQTWRESQLQPAPTAKDSTSVGRAVFMSAACPMCHTVAGTDARASVGPNLSHIGSAKTIAAGTLTNTAEHMSEWIADPSHRKPGVLMPGNPLNPQELGALVGWLESLK